MNSIAIVASWMISEVDAKLYLPSTHYVYLQYISTEYEKIYLISTRASKNTKINNTELNIPNVEYIPLPYISSYINSMNKIIAWYRALKSIKDKSDVVYCRVPDPFSWMPTLFFGKKTIMHFVGDTIDATMNNEKWSYLKKITMIAGYLPDYALTLLAARHSKVYTNGGHLARKLSKYGIKATSVISSTVSEKSFVEPNVFKVHSQIRLIYIGYIRYAKGISTLMNLWIKLKYAYPDFIFDVVGNGEMFEDVQRFIIENNLAENIRLHGCINDRDKMNLLLRLSDLFIFPSLSEGSPRVVIEAMSQGTPVISTPVGSLPTTFVEGETIRFFDYHNVDKVFEIIKEFGDNPKPFILQRDKAYQLVKENYTIELFLRKVFTY